MKRTISLILIIISVLSLIILPGCKGSAGAKKSSAMLDADKIFDKDFADIGAEYIIGDNIILHGNKAYLLAHKSEKEIDEFNFQDRFSANTSFDRFLMAEESSIIEVNGYDIKMYMNNVTYYIITVGIYDGDVKYTAIDKSILGYSSLNMELFHCFCVSSDNIVYLFDGVYIYTVSLDDGSLSEVSLRDINPDFKGYSQMTTDSMGFIFLADYHESDLLILSPDFRPLARIAMTPDTLSMIKDTDNNVYLTHTEYKSGGRFFYLSQIHEQDGEYVETKIENDNINPPDNVNLQTKVFSITLEADETIFLSSPDGIFKYGYGADLESSEAALVVDWLYSGIHSKNVVDFKPLGEDRFAAIIKNSENRNTLAFLTRADPQAVAKKNVIIMAHNCYTQSDLDTLTKVIVDFNLTNNENIVILKDYTVYRVSHSNDGWERLSLDMSTGDIPDMLYIDNHRYAVNYSNLGILADLYPFFDGDKSLTREDLLYCIRSALEKKDKLHLIPTSYYLNSLVGKTADTGTETISQSEFFDFDAKLEESVKSYNFYDIFSYSLEASVDYYVDFENQTCRFTGEDFIELLKYSKKFDSGRYFMSHKDDIITKVFPSYGNNLFYYKSHLKALKDTDGIYINSGTGSVFEYIFAKYCFDGEDFSYIGYPSPDGGNITLTARSSLAITDASEQKDGAWEFLKYFLSDEVQFYLTDDVQTTPQQSVLVAESRLRSFPVTVSALDRYLEDSVNCDYRYIIRRSYDGSISQLLLDKLSKSRNKYYDSTGYEHTDFIEFTEKDASFLKKLLCETDMKGPPDTVMLEIIKEEQSAYLAGSITAQECVKYIQDRVSTYVSEQY